MRVVFGYLVKAALFIGLDLFLRRFLGPVVSNLSALIGFGLCEAWSLVRHAGIDAVVDFLMDKPKEIFEFVLGLAVLTVPLWVGSLLLWYGHPLLAWPLMIVGEPAWLALVCEDERREIIEWSFAIPVIAAPLLVGCLLSWFEHPILAAPLIFVGEPAWLVYVVKHAPPKEAGPEPPPGGNRPTDPPPEAGTPGAVAPA
ncbi:MULTISPECIES: hypothetical protein [unclassified Bradyrhizobium]|uniref:hypothetical protein n=1 Tax=unclassified Bradyrhizobium TaxID=2631580 RepID=UPI002479C394|nr:MULTISPECIES: hypothetical protein [unclassified Bradyrhizobium]WGS20147.1 hypothetical protein MTX22_38640 [Bradyrhizobium sp. ISRA463]WGS27009.1 hypothetical protein MTX19_36065 [Bradyrhizobium sp. ISRA464]